MEPTSIGTPAVAPQQEPENPPNQSEAHNVPIPETIESEESFYACEEDCFHLDSSQAWKFGVYIGQQDINRWK